jgi:hypothetical protein
MSHKTAATFAPTIGIDTGKNTLHLIGLDDNGAMVLREKIARGRIAARFANVPRCLIGIEAGMATHYVARELIAGRFDVRFAPNNRHHAPAIRCPKSADIVAKVFLGCRPKILRAADAPYARRREGPYRFIQNRSRTGVVALKSSAAAETSKDRLSRGF